MTDRRAALPRMTDRLDLGSKGLRVSPFCLGRVKSPDTVLAAFDAGINFFFVTADMHWPGYENLREGRLFRHRVREVQPGPSRRATRRLPAGCATAQDASLWIHERQPRDRPGPLSRPRPLDGLLGSDARRLL